MKEVLTSLRLYRYLLRRISVLPYDAREHYRHRIRQEYRSHSDERDPVRINQIIQQSVKDIEWIVNKYQSK